MKTQEEMKTFVTKDLKNGVLEVSREFAADVPLVWKAWTEAELLDQWWAPRPWRSETKSMDFRPGGKWIYEMVGPNGERHGAVQIFNEIKKEQFYSGKDAFADATGKINETLPVSDWKNTFIATENGTRVKTIAKYASPEALQTVLNMGMEEGLTMAQRNLDELLIALKGE
jgi:uncharacterized protein YndB with AHSA1/START domain